MSGNLPRGSVPIMLAHRGPHLPSVGPAPAYNQVMDVQGQVAVVTGGARGIGRAIALRLIAAGASVVIADLDAEASAATAAAIGADSLPTDVGDPAEVDRLFGWIAQRFGQLHILVNNAGIGASMPPEQLDVATWDHVLNVNLRGAFLCAKAAAVLMRANGAGAAIINIASTRALMSEPGNEAYAASKGGLLALTHALANSLGPRIRVNAICPGWIDTRHEALRPEDHAQHPAGRVGRPEDVAEACLFLASSASSFMTGQYVVLDGGMTRKMIYLE
jgi:NAD(P)-dependent dehydrogenase (short-subunit alcohol dehydrogenase family)